MEIFTFIKVPPFPVCQMNLISLQISNRSFPQLTGPSSMLSAIRRSSYLVSTKHSMKFLWIDILLVTIIRQTSGCPFMNGDATKHPMQTAFRVFKQNSVRYNDRDVRLREPTGMVLL